MVKTVQENAIAIALLIVSAAIFAKPVTLLARFNQLPLAPHEAVFALYGFAAGCIALAIAIFFRQIRNPLAWLLFLGAALAAYWFQTQHMAEWWIDDAGITFSYSRSLAEGHGLTYQPWHPPEEGYSSSLWMLALAMAGWLGFDIQTTAKLVGIAFGGASIALVVFAIRRSGATLLAAAMALAVLTVAPFSIWAASGQEHAMQAFLLISIALLLGAGFYKFATLFLTLFVFARPEAPFIVAACFFTAVFLSYRAGKGFELRRNLPIAFVPFIAFLALMAFRAVYFGDFFPNPFYVKTSNSSLFGLINPFGGGWAYVLSFLVTSAAAIALPFALVSDDTERTGKVAFPMAIIVGHLLFVIWAKGDWMQQYRFIMPILPLFALLVGRGMATSNKFTQSSGLTVALFFVISTNTVLTLNTFKDAPTTPLASVAIVGETFADLADRMSIEDPLLAHHDAGAIAYERKVRLLDLAGLVNRSLAQNATDAKFLEQYVLVDNKPDFVFGGRLFVARTGIFDTDSFNADYVPITFVDKAYMDTEFGHVRREKISQGPGIDLKQDASGKITEVIVLP